MTRRRVVYEEVEHAEQTHLVVALGECFLNKQKLVESFELSRTIMFLFHFLKQNFSYEEDGQPTSDTRFMRSISGGAIPIGAQSFMEDGEGDFANCNGGLYVDNDSKTINGGFGGGGSGARYAAGGGGGYGGGGGGPDEGYAGGGGSFIDPNLAEDPKEEVINYSGGEVIIELL